jgi:F-type H+-transporting ATPase subunit epsilon
MGPVIEVKVVSPTATLLEVDARGVQVPGLMGEMGILPNHAAAIVQLKPGVVSIAGVSADDSARFFVADGFVQVENNVAVILARTVEVAHSVDADRAQRALERALKRLDAKDVGLDIDRALAALARARARISLTAK